LANDEDGDGDLENAPTPLEYVIDHQGRPSKEKQVHHVIQTAGERSQSLHSLSAGENTPESSVLDRQMFHHVISSIPRSGIVAVLTQRHAQSSLGTPNLPGEELGIHPAYNEDLPQQQSHIYSEKSFWPLSDPSEARLFLHFVRKLAIWVRNASKFDSTVTNLTLRLA
jgi:hypothetical protein